MIQTGLTDASLTGRLSALLTDPVTLVALGLAGAALAGIAFASRRSRAAKSRRPRQGVKAPATPTQPIPLLETPMQPVLAAPRRNGAASDQGIPLVSGLAFAAVGVAAFAGLLAFGLKVAGPAPYGEGFQTTGLEAVEPRPSGSAAWSGAAIARPGDAAGCQGGLDGHRASYTHCEASVPVTFEVVGLSKDGQRLNDAVWSGAGRRAFVLTAKGLPAPFTLSRGADILPAPGSALSDYDAYIAVGYADEGRDGGAAAQRAEARSLALADLALRAARGGRAADCRSDVMVHAVSLGAADSGPAPSPLLIGVSIDDRINRPDGDMGDLNAMLDGLFASRGAVITGLDPDAYGPWAVLASERACDRSPV